MPVHGAHAHLLRRQDSSLSQVIQPSIDGLSGAQSLGTANPTASGLIFDTAAQNSATPNLNSQQLMPSSTVVASNMDSGDSSQNSISNGAVVGACVGAFVLFAAVVLLAYWYFHRPIKSKPSRPGPYDDSHHHHSNPMVLSPLAQSLNAQAEAERVRAADRKRGVYQSSFNDSKEDVFSAREKTSPVPSAYTMNTQTRLIDKRPTPSLHSIEHDRMSTLTNDLSGDASFSKYHPFLAEEIALPPVPRVSHGRGDSWGSETNTTDRNTQFSRSDVDLQFGHGRTPSFKSNVSSANRNPFDDPASLPRSAKPAENPFFSANNPIPARKRAASNAQTNPFASSSTTPSTSVANIHIVPPPVMPALVAERGKKTHAAADSIGSNTSDRALASLVAALNVSPEEVQERLRIASMQSLQPSIVSTAASDDEHNIDEFPLPPTLSLYPPPRL